MSVKLPEELKNAGFGSQQLKEIASALDRKQTNVLPDVIDAIESGCTDTASVIDYIRPGDNPAPAPTPLSVQAGGGFRIGSFISQMSAAHEETLLDPGRYNVTIVDTCVGAESNDIGLKYGLLFCTVDGHPEADEIPIFAAVDVDDDLKTADGLALDKMDPIARSRFLGGLKTIQKLIKFSDVTAEELAGVENPEDALACFIGTKLKVVLAKGKDQNDLPSNKIKSILGRSDV